jgi:hypothetical protein
MKSPVDFFRALARHGLKNTQAQCALRSCHNALLIGSVPQRRVGIRVGVRWYCSVDCFAEATVSRLGSLASGRLMQMPHKPRLSIGLVLISKGQLTDHQLRYAVAESQLNGERLEAALVRLGLATEKQLAAARAAQWGCPVLAQELLSEAVEADLPATLLQHYSAAPVHYSVLTKRLLLGFVQRVEHTLLHAIEQVAGCRAEPCFITPTESREQMGRLTAAPDYKEVVLEDPLTPAQMARTVGGFALEVSAREASFASCQDFVWTRLSGKRHTVDVLFRGRSLPEVNRGEGDLASEEEIDAVEVKHSA